MLSFFKCVFCSVLINVHELALKINVENMHGERTKTRNLFYDPFMPIKKA